MSPNWQKIGYSKFVAYSLIEAKLFDIVINIKR